MNALSYLAGYMEKVAFKGIKTVYGSSGAVSKPAKFLPDAKDLVAKGGAAGKMTAKPSAKPEAKTKAAGKTLEELEMSGGKPPAKTPAAANATASPAADMSREAAQAYKEEADRLTSQVAKVIKEKSKQKALAKSRINPMWAYAGIPAAGIAGGLGGAALGSSNS